MTTAKKQETPAAPAAEAKQEAPAAEAKQEAPAAEAKQEAPAAEAKQHPYTVAAGAAVVTRKGIIGSGEAIEPAWVNGGETCLANLVKSGHVVKA